MSLSNSLPLANIKVIEFAGLAPVPFAGQILSDWGADVIRVDRTNVDQSKDLLVRGKRSIAINLKAPSGLEVVKKLIQQADILIEPFRPDVMEKLGLGPDVFLGENGLNKRLIYARLVGFSRTDIWLVGVMLILLHPRLNYLSGHDLNYLALSGILSVFPGPPDKPSFPLNLLADFAGGGLTCALGILLALFERTKSNQGQVVDTDMVSGTRYISTFLLLGLLLQLPTSSGPRRTNLLDGGAPFYNVYTCSDGRWMSVACLEPHFFREFITIFNRALPPTFSPEWRPTPELQMDTNEWDRLAQFLTDGFKTNPRDYWAKVFHGTDSCALPVLSPSEAISLASVPIPIPHPNLTRAHPQPPLQITRLSPGQHTDEILRELGIAPSEQSKMEQEGSLRKRETLVAKL